MNESQEQPTTVAPANSPIFATTRWTVVLNAGNAHSADQADALAQLCQTYWYPLYAFIRRQGATVEDAQDLTQEFFAQHRPHPRKTLRTRLGAHALDPGPRTIVRTL
jgi:hypothetical protein